MIYKNIYELRKVLISELTNIDTNVAIKLPYEKDLLQQLIFENGCIFENIKPIF